MNGKRRYKSHSMFLNKRACFEIKRGQIRLKTFFKIPSVSIYSSFEDYRDINISLIKWFENVVMLK